MNRNAKRILLLFALLMGFMPIVVTAQDSASQGLTLRQCLTTALAKNPAVLEARLGIKSADESIISAKGKHWPRLSIDGSYTRRQEPFPYIQAQAITIPAHFSDEWSYIGVAMTIPLYQGGQISTGVSLAEVRRDMQRLTVNQTKNDIIANTVNTYNKILQLQALRRASHAQVKAMEEQTKNTNLLLEVGRAARVDLLKVEVQLANEQQRLLTIDEGLKTTGATLRYLMGEETGPENPLPVLADPLTAGNFIADYKSGLTLARQQRPEYLSAKKGVEEAGLNKRLALGKMLPTINFYAADMKSTSYGPWYDDNMWAGGLTLTIPLFDRSLYADLSRERIQMERASQRLFAADNQLGLDLATAVASLGESRNRVTATEKAVTQAEESFRIEQQRYENGAGSMADFLMAQAASIQAASNYTQALFDYNAALVAYRKATGTLEEYLP